MDKLTDQQLREYNDAFHMFDRRGKGYLTTGEIKFIVRSLGFNPTDIELENLNMTVDHDGNGKIDFEEFVGMMQSCRKPKDDEESRLESFRAFDIHNKGHIPTKDIRDALMHIMEKASDKDKELILKVFRLDVERNVDYEEFRRMISTAADLEDAKK